MFHITLGFLGAEAAKLNASMSTDDYKPFDRTLVRGRVSQPSSQQNTRPSSSAGSESSFVSTPGGVSIGGEKQREESNLLQMTPAVLRSENSEEDIELIEESKV